MDCEARDRVSILESVLAGGSVVVGLVHWQWSLTDDGARLEFRLLSRRSVGYANGGSGFPHVVFQFGGTKAASEDGDGIDNVVRRSVGWLSMIEAWWGQLARFPPFFICI